MTCKDCLFHEMCYMIEHYGWNEEDGTCVNFKNKHGHWLSVGFGEYWCSVCDENGEDVFNKRGNPNWKYCPHCGTQNKKIDAK